MLLKTDDEEQEQNRGKRRGKRKVNNKMQTKDDKQTVMGADPNEWKHESVETHMKSKYGVRSDN